jgi:hypothetical protein
MNYIILTYNFFLIKSKHIIHFFEQYYYTLLGSNIIITYTITNKHKYTYKTRPNTEKRQ